MTHDHAGSSGWKRRGVLHGGAALLAAGGLGARTPAQAATGSLLSQLPSAAQFTADVRKMCELGPRYPGTAAHDAFVDRLDAGFRSAGLQVTRDRHHFTRWLAGGRSLELLEGSYAGTVPVASAYPYSGRTDTAGVTGELAYLGPVPIPPLSGDLTDLGAVLAAITSFQSQLPAALAGLLAAVPGGVAGKIVVFETPIPPLSWGIVQLLMTDKHDPDGSIRATDDFKRAWVSLLTMPPLDPFKLAGAAGVVFILDASPANALGQYTTFIHGYKDLPALIVDREAGARLRAAAGRTPRTRLVLQATVTPHVGSDSLVAVLPGEPSNNETMIAHTHTDGQNAFEENGGLALVALARHFARSRSLRRSLVFSAVTGHFVEELPETAGFLEQHPDLVARAVASVTVEHFGAMEWLDDARGYHPTGQVEPGVIFHSLTPVASAGREAMKAVDLRRSLLLKPIGPFFFGVGAPLHAAGIPGLAYIGSPNYLLAEAGRQGHLDKFSGERMRRETAWAGEALQHLDAMPAAWLKLGDSLLYGLR